MNIENSAFKWRDQSEDTQRYELVTEYWRNISIFWPDRDKYWSKENEQPILTRKMNIKHLWTSTRLVIQL